MTRWRKWRRRLPPACQIRGAVDAAECPHEGVERVKYDGMWFWVCATHRPLALTMPYEDYWTDWRPRRDSAPRLPLDG